MYNPPAFKRDRIEDLFLHVGRFPLGVVVSSHAGEVRVSHIPFIVNGAVIEGHLTVYNDHVNYLESASNVTVVFSGPNGYVSPSWYVSTELAPTWNFVAAHVSGAPVIMRDKMSILDILDRQIAAYEGAAGTKWELSKMDESTRDSLVGKIVGIRVPVTRFSVKYKLSQNRESADFDNVISSLHAAGDKGRELAGIMAEYSKI